jgi:glycosyltransferase involved in cell wall biosynthesis
MSAPLVSVVVPVYNGSRYLRQALDSALGQTYRSLEVVVVDDGSTDSSPEIIASYGSRIRPLRQPNGGVALARNAGLRASAGDLIAFLDQDDWWLPEKVEKQVALFRADAELGLVHTGILQYSENAGAFVDSVYVTDRSPRLQGRCYGELLQGNAIFNSSVMIRRSVLDNSGLFDPSLAGNTCQDYDLWLRIARHHTLDYIPEQLAVLRLHGEQGTWNRRDMLGDELRLLERALGRQGLHGSPEIRARVAELLHDLGMAHLDANAPRLARRCFARALRLRWERRLALLYVVSLLPGKGINWLRRQRARWGRAAAGETGTVLPRYSDGGNSGRQSGRIVSPSAARGTRQVVR